MIFAIEEYFSQLKFQEKSEDSNKITTKNHNSKTNWCKDQQITSAK